MDSAVINVLFKKFTSNLKILSWIRDYCKKAREQPNSCVTREVPGKNNLSCFRTFSYSSFYKFKSV